MSVGTSVDITGWGFTYVGTKGARIVRDIIIGVLAPLLIGSSATDVEGLWNSMYQEALLIGRRGAVLRAMSAIDIALFDAAAKRADLSLGQFLGGGRNFIPAYASGGYYGDDEPLSAVEAEIEHNRRHGFRDHKIKVGRLSVVEDAARVHVARTAVGPEGRLALDANNAYSTASDAIAAGRAFERAAAPDGVWWFEEPLSPEDIRGHAQVAAALETPVATGEIHQTRWEFREIIELGAAAILQADAAVVGGISEWRRIAALASAFNLPLAPHWNANLHVPLAAATPNCVVIEHFELDKGIYNFEQLVTEETRLRPEQGAIAVPSGPGLGFEFDQAAIAKHTLND